MNLASLNLESMVSDSGEIPRAPHNYEERERRRTGECRQTREGIRKQVEDIQGGYIVHAPFPVILLATKAGSELRALENFNDCK